MDKLKTDLYGGFPFELDDWRWELDAHRKALAAVALGLCSIGGRAILIDGVDIMMAPSPYVGPQYISAGWVAYTELFEFKGAAGVLTLPLSRHYLTLDIDFDPAGSRTFQDGSIQNPYERRRLKLVADGQDYDNNIMYIPLGGPQRAMRLPQLLSPGPWMNLPAAPNFVPAGDLLPAQYRLAPGGVVQFRGALRAEQANSSVSIPLFDVPGQIKPAQSVALSTVVTGLLTTKLAVIEVSNAFWPAQLTIASGISAGDIIRFDGLSYIL